MTTETMPAQGQVDVNVMPHTPGPWDLGEFDECLGYDCMTGGVRAGPAVLDGGDYGQKLCTEIDPEAKARMLADAALIAAAPELLSALEYVLNTHFTTGDDGEDAAQNARAVIAKVKRHNAKVTGTAPEKG